MYQSLLFSLTYYFENLAQDKLKLEKIYYAIYQSPQKLSIFIELEPLIVLQKEIARIKLFIRNLDISAFEMTNPNLEVFKDYLISIQKIIFYICHGIVSDLLWDEIENIKKIIINPEVILTDVNKFYKESFINEIIPELLKIREEIFVRGLETDIWIRQLNLANLLLNRKLDIPTALELIRESIISWICEKIMNQYALNESNRQLAEDNIEKIKSGDTFSRLIQNLFERRNQYAHVFTDKNKIESFKKYSENLDTLQQELKNDFKTLSRFLKEGNNIKERIDRYKNRMR